MSINRMYYGTQKVYSFLEKGSNGGNVGEDCNCEQEYQNGYDSGYDNGYSNGYKDGSANVDCNCDDAYNNGYNDGVNSVECNCDDAYNEGYNNGYSDGQNNCVGGEGSIFSQLGYSKEDEQILFGEAIEYSKELVEGIEMGPESYNKFIDNDDYVFFPTIDWSNVEDASGAFRWSESLLVVGHINGPKIHNIEALFEDCPSLLNVASITVGNIHSLNLTFKGCHRIRKIPLFNTRTVTNFENCFCNCRRLKTIPQFDMSNAENVKGMFDDCPSLESLPLLNFSKVTQIEGMFGWGDPTNLTDAGGFEGLMIDWNDDGGLIRCPNLTYESLMNIYNTIYDFRRGGSMATMHLKLHSDSLAKLSESDINNFLNKGWILTA